MRKIVLIFGSIAGLICGLMFFINHPGDDVSTMDMDRGMIIGYATMIISLSGIFFAVRQYRDKYLGGTISFGKSFLIGLYITLVASVIYVVAWEIYYTNFGSNFGEVYVEYQKQKWTEEGMSTADIEKNIAEQQGMMDTYKTNMPFRLALTFTEIFPVGLIISLICAVIFGVVLRKSSQSV
ncbi:MAG: DUF4199 domain-containing protein [Bacteroidia bacterium]|nr:DUF4199 domain-containing protein [Bacteroidia bacterium]